MNATHLPSGADGTSSNVFHCLSLGATKIPMDFNWTCRNPFLRPNIAWRIHVVSPLNPFCQNHADWTHLYSRCWEPDWESLPLQPRTLVVSIGNVWKCSWPVDVLTNFSSFQNPLKDTGQERPTNIQPIDMNHGKSKIELVITSYHFHKKKPGRSWKQASASWSPFYFRTVLAGLKPHIMTLHT